jgi:MFS family permease
VAKVFSGALSDYWGKRKELAIAGYGLSTLVKPLFAVANTSGWVLIARFGDRVGKGIRGAPRDALVADVTDAKNRGAAYGLRQSLDTVGAVLGPLAAAALMLISGQNFRLVFWVAVVPGILAVALLAWGVKESSQAAQPLYSPLSWNRINPVGLNLLGKDYWRLVGVALLFSLGNSSDAFLLLRSQQVRVGASLVPLSLAVMNATYALSAYPLGWLSDSINRDRLLIGGFFLYALIYLGFAWVQTPWQIWILFALYGLYLGMTQGVMLALVADQVPATLRGTAFGLINLAIGLTLLPASLLAGALWKWASPQATFMAGSLFAAIAAIALLLLPFRSQVKKL